MDVFNPKILDASIRDVSSCLTNNQKVDLLLYALSSLQYDSRSRIVIENAIQSCLNVTTLSPENIAKARILRARARLNAGSFFSAQDDLQAALAADPDNPEAKALLHKRSVTVEKLLSPQPVVGRRGQFSNEIWREIALFLPKRDLKTLLCVPHPLSRIASQLLFYKIDLHFSGSLELEEDHGAWDASTHRDQDTHHAQRSADILTRMITDPSFAAVVRALRIYALKPDKDGSMAFQTGILANALPKLINLRHVHLSAGAESLFPILRILTRSRPHLRSLSLQIPEGSFELADLDFQHINHLAYEATGPVPTEFLQQNRLTLRTLCLENPSWIFPSEFLSIRNLTHIHFLGHFPSSSHAIADILSNGRQLESLSLNCLLDCTPSSQFRSLRRDNLPFLRHFAFSVSAMNRRLVDRDLFPAISEFLRDRKQLKTLMLIVPEEYIQRAVGFDASVWGVLPSLVNLKGLTVTYPRDLAPGLASWLVPRSVVSLTLDGVNPGRDTISFLNQLRVGIPPSLRMVGFSDLPLRPANMSVIIEQGFPMVRILRVGPNYWTVCRKPTGEFTELEAWPKRRAMFQTAEWLEWLGCDEGEMPDRREFHRL